MADAVPGRLRSIVKNVLIFTDSRAVTELVKRALVLLVMRSSPLV